MGSALCLPLPLPLMSDGPATAADIWWCPLAPPLMAEAIPCGRRGTGVANNAPALLLAAADTRSGATLRGAAGEMPATGVGGPAVVAAMAEAAVAACDGGGLQYRSERSGFTVPKRSSWCSGRVGRRKQEGSDGSLGLGTGAFGAGLPLERRAGKRIGT